MAPQEPTAVLVGENQEFSQIWLIAILVAIVSTPVVVFCKQSVPWLITVPIWIGVLLVLLAEFKHWNRLRLKKPKLFTGVTFLVVALHLSLPGYATRKGIIKRFSRSVPEEVSEAVSFWRGHPASVQARLNRRIAWIQQDFTEDPLSILDTMDRGLFSWATRTTSSRNKIHFVIPSTNHFAILTNLSRPLEGGAVDWNLSDNPPDPVISALLENALTLKQVALRASQQISQVNLSWDFLLPFADMFSQPERLVAAASNNPLAPTTKELSAFWDSTAKILSQAQLMRLLGSARSGPRGLFLCSLVDPQSGGSVLVLFHTAWKPRAGLALFEGTFVGFNPEEWQTEVEIVMPPYAWDIEKAWSRLK